AIFSADPATKRQFLRRWLRESTLEADVDIRDILDWDYYLERFGSVIQKLITIPAAMQGVSNPVPRIRHPDWLSKRVSAALNKHKQRHITDVFKKVSKEDYLLKAAAQDAADDSVDMEDFGSSIGSAMARPKTGVARRTKAVAEKAESVESLGLRLAQLGVAPSPSDGYAAWLQHSKQVWALKRRLRELRAKSASDNDVVSSHPDGASASASAAAASGIGQFFSRSQQQSLARGVWHVLQWEETDTPGELKAWVLVGGQAHSVCVSVPRTLYVTSAVVRQEMAGSRFFSEARGMVLPRSSSSSNGNMHLYKCVMAEAEYAEFRSSWSAFFAHPGIGGVYETEVTCLDRALIDLGATVWMTAAARRVGRGDVVALGDLDTRRSALTQPPGVGGGWSARDASYALLYHGGSADGRHHFYALVMPYAGRGHVWVVNTAQ
ncbi:DNA polymerase epsilon catalytic subunit, partial [Coemansia aciculifera]